MATDVVLDAMTNEDTGNNTLQRYDCKKFTMIGSGGEHIVLTSPEHPGIVYKVNYTSVIDLLARNRSKGNPLDYVDPEWEEKYKAEAERRNAGNNKLRTYFGNHVPSFTTETARVTFDHEVISKAFKEEIDIAEALISLPDVPAQVSIQDIVDLPSSENQLSFDITSLQIDALTPEDIANIDQNFLFDKETDYTSQIEKAYPSLGGILKAAESNPQYRDAVRDFVDRLIMYTADTGEAIDIEGKDNVIFYDKDGKIEYTLMDALLLDPKNFMRNADRFTEWVNGNKEGTNIQTVVPHNVNYLRALNALAWKTGSEKRLSKIQGKDIIPHVHDVTKYLQDLKKVEKDSSVSIPPDSREKAIEHFRTDYVDKNDLRETGFGGTEEEWRFCREIITQAIDKSGTFLDLGCANGRLVFDLQKWMQEKGVNLDIFGVDFVPELIDKAQKRFPNATDHFQTADVTEYTPNRQYDYIRTELGYFPGDKVKENLQRYLTMVKTGGKLIVTKYDDDTGEEFKKFASVMTELGIGTPTFIYNEATCMAVFEKFNEVSTNNPQ